MMITGIPKVISLHLLMVPDQGAVGVVMTEKLTIGMARANIYEIWRRWVAFSG